MVSSLSGMSASSNNYTPQVNTAPAFSSQEVIEDESIFGKKGVGGQVDDLSIFTQSECYSDSTSFSDSSGIEA